MDKVYQLDECVDCAHRKVCRYVDKINSLIQDLPLDLRGATCDEYDPDDTIDTKWMEESKEEKEILEDIEDIEDKEYIEELIESSIVQFLAQGGEEVECVYLPKDVYETFNQKYFMFEGNKIPLKGIDGNNLVVYGIVEGEDEYYGDTEDGS